MATVGGGLRALSMQSISIIGYTYEFSANCADEDFLMRSKMEFIVSKYEKGKVSASKMIVTYHQGNDVMYGFIDR
eukprot:scaffold3389_cov188-Chaetoceros_neogracile.AAC.10